MSERGIGAAIVEDEEWPVPRVITERDLLVAVGSGLDPDSELAQDEVFGPVLAAMPFDSEEEAIRLANGTDYGLVAGVWSGDGSRAIRVARKVRAGQLFVNGYGAGGGIELPFGGMKKSGHGREKGFEALYEFGALKTLVVKHG